MTHVGRVRKNNEDAFLALAYDANEVRYLGKTGEATLDHCDYVFAVSDGMGGANAGEFASRTAVERITRLMPKMYRLGAAKVAGGMNDALEEIMSHVHEAITRMGRSYEECRGMGATLSLACFSPGWMHFAHIGDSRIYYLPKDGGMMQVSHDHSYVGWLRRQGQINEREARNHPRKNVLNQALGGGHQILNPQFGAVSCHPGDKFFLCSDGIVDGLWDSRIEEYLRTPAEQPKAFTLVNQAVAASGKDNCTALVIEFAQT